VPLILTLVYVGAFAEKNVFEDLGIVLVFGALGLAMARLGWPRPPLLLAWSWGRWPENRLFLATDNYGAALAAPARRACSFSRSPWPVCCSPFSSAGGAPAVAAATRPATRGLTLDGSTAFSLALVLLFLWALWQSRKFGVRAGLFPWAVMVPALALSIVQLVRDVTGRRETRATTRRPAARRSSRRKSSSGAPWRSLRGSSGCSRRSGWWASGARRW
jgi:hypothetical protein